MAENTWATGVISLLIGAPFHSIYNDRRVPSCIYMSTEVHATRDGVRDICNDLQHATAINKKPLGIGNVIQSYLKSHKFGLAIYKYIDCFIKII